MGTAVTFVAGENGVLSTDATIAEAKTKRATAIDAETTPAEYEREALKQRQLSEQLDWPRE